MFVCSWRVCVYGVWFVGMSVDVCVYGMLCVWCVYVYGVCVQCV